MEQHGVALRAVAFGGGDWEQNLNETTGPLSVAFKPIINNFRGSYQKEAGGWKIAGC